jgi:hypothetical protein
MSTIFLNCVDLATRHHHEADLTAKNDLAAQLAVERMKLTIVERQRLKAHETDLGAIAESVTHVVGGAGK